MAVKDSGKVLGKEIANEVKKVSDNITSPFKQFMPGLIAGLPGGAMLEKSFKALSISNKKEQDDTTTELKEQTGLLGGMNSGLAKLSDTLTNQNKTLIGTIAGQDKGGLSAAEVEKANEERRREENQITLLEKISGGIGDMLKGFLNATAAGAGMGLGAVLGLIAAPFVTIAAFFKSLKAEIKVLDSLLGGKLGAPFKAIKGFFTKIDDALRITDKVDDVVLGAKNAMASVKGFFSGFVGKFKAGTLGVVDDIVLGAKNGIASVKTFFSGFAGKLNIVDKADDLVLGAKNGVASVKTFFTGFKGQLTIADTATDLLAPVKSTFASIKGFLAPFKSLTILPAAAAGAGAAGKTAETAVDGAKAGVNAIKGIMATVKSFMSPLRLGLVAMDAVVATMQPIIKFAGTLGTVPVSYTHLRAHETKANLVCRLLLEKKRRLFFVV